MLKFSEALRLGSMLCPKAIGIRLGENGERCALGAAELGAGVDLAERYWPALMLTWAVHPEIKLTCPLIHIVASLNNGCSHGGFNQTWEPWTREAIADWYMQFETDEITVESRPEPVPESVVSLVA